MLQLVATVQLRQWSRGAVLRQWSRGHVLHIL